jgi:hypothetical protein
MVLTDEEKDLVVAFNTNVKMKEAVKKVLLQGIYDNGVIKQGEAHDETLNWALSLAWGAEAQGKTVEEIGKKFLAIAEGIRFLKSAFTKIGGYTQGAVVQPPKNKAR